jgi:hypothetical protein
MRQRHERRVRVSAEARFAWKPADPRRDETRFVVRPTAPTHGKSPPHV